MEAQAPAIPVWPYGVQVEVSANGLLLRPRGKPRADWAKAFERRTTRPKDEFASLREIQNKFDAEDWQW